MPTKVIKQKQRDRGKRKARARWRNDAHKVPIYARARLGIITLDAKACAQRKTDD